MRNIGIALGKFEEGPGILIKEKYDMHFISYQCTHIVEKYWTKHTNIMNGHGQMF